MCARNWLLLIQTPLLSNYTYDGAQHGTSNLGLYHMRPLPDSGVWGQKSSTISHMQHYKRPLKVQKIQQHIEILTTTFSTNPTHSPFHTPFHEFEEWCALWHHSRCFNRLGLSVKKSVSPSILMDDFWWAHGAQKNSDSNSIPLLMIFIPNS